MHTYFYLLSIEIILLAAVLVCKAPKDRSITVGMTTDDVDRVSRAQYIAIQTIKNRELEGYGQHEVSF